VFWRRDALRRAEAAARLELLFAHFPDLLVVADARGHFLDVNPVWERLFGYTAEELKAKPFLDFVHPDDQAATIAMYASQQQGAEATAFVNRYRCRDGSYRWLEWNATPVSAGTMIFAMARDITDRRRIEEQLRTFTAQLEERREIAETQLQQAQKMEALGQFAGGIAHDFNNILTVIMGTADRLRTNVAAGGPDVEAHIRQLSEAAARGRQLIARLTSFGRREAVIPRPVDVGRAVRESVETFRYLLPANIEVRVTVSDQLPAARLDPPALTQILMNLATNARDAMPGGGRLEVTVRETAEARGIGAVLPVQGQFVCVAVQDNGSGMDEETKRRAFEPLFTTKPQGLGTGLGLPMVLGLIEQQDGAVNLESAPGRGTEIELFFRAAPAPAPLGRPEPASAAAAQHGPGTLLVADADPSVRRGLTLALERVGYRVVAAADGAEALATLERLGDAVGLVISDSGMPKMTGPQLYRALRAAGRTVPFLSTTGSPDEAAAASGDPRWRMLSKPWTVDELLQAVRDMLAS
jgi:PAS domain S-box-containing protein